MSDTLHQFLTNATKKAAADLEAALQRLPEDKRGWKPMDKARSALDQAAECALINGHTVDLIKTRIFEWNGDFSEFERAKVALSQDEKATLSQLHENTARVIDAINSVPAADLGVEIQMPWGTMTMAQIIAYPYWNMSYHEGQINYIASMLDSE